MLQLEYKPYNLELKHVFRISRGSRSSSPLMLLRIGFENHFGYGEASMPPLYGESHRSAFEFLSRLDLSQFASPFELETILSYVDGVLPAHPAIKAAVDIALHDLIGRLLELPVHQYLGLAFREHPSSMTIGIDEPEIMAARAKQHAGFRYLKIKLGTPDDKARIRAIRQVSDQPFFIDANQAWKDKEAALDFIYWLKEQQTIFIEQPMPREMKAELAWLSARSPLPVIGDEGVQRLSDLQEASGLYHGINIKLMKSTGIREGFKMAVAARALGMKVMLGCMSETSCAISAAAQLGALADWVDLDGNLDAKNDPFQGIKIQQGLLAPSFQPGIGLHQPDWDRITAVK